MWKPFKCRCIVDVFGTIFEERNFYDVKIVKLFFICKSVSVAIIKHASMLFHLFFLKIFISLFFYYFFKNKPLSEKVQIGDDLQIIQDKQYKRNGCQLNIDAVVQHVIMHW